MKFSKPDRPAGAATQVLGIAAGTALLGAAAIAVVGVTASHASPPQTATLSALSHPRPPARPTPRAARSHTRSSSGLAAKQAKSGSVPRPPAAPPVREGRVVSTGIRDGSGELVFYGVRIRVRELPGTTFGIMAGRRDSSGRLTPQVEGNETTGSDTAAGFHAVESAASIGRPPAAIPEFGYYAGPAVKITAMNGGQQVQASTARWSANPRIVIFWFSPATDPGGAPLHGLTAYDTAGHQLPAGSNSPGSG